jgi:hypothetical protein
MPAKVAIFRRVGSKPQELDGLGHTINGTSTWTTLQSLSRAYFQINKPTTLCITYPTYLVYSQENLSSEVSKVLVQRGRERETYEIAFDLPVSVDLEEWKTVVITIGAIGHYGSPNRPRGGFKHQPVEKDTPNETISHRVGP